MHTTHPRRKPTLSAAAMAVAAGLAFATFGALPGPAFAAELEIDAVNKMDHAAFTEALGGIFETINERGELILRDSNGERQAIAAGDIFPLNAKAN